MEWIFENSWYFWCGFGEFGLFFGDGYGLLGVVDGDVVFEDGYDYLYFDGFGYWYLLIESCYDDDGCIFCDDVC